VTTPFDPSSTPRSPLAGRRAATVLALLAVVALVDLVLGWARPPRAVAVLPDGVQDVRTILDRVASEPDAWLLVGDSVLAGDVMRGHVRDWSQHRVIDALRANASGATPPVFEQVALDGMLPVDMARVVRELDVADPRGTVGLVLELNPRYFSRYYAGQRECSRSWLCELGPDVGGAASAGTVWREVGRSVLRHMPLWRHRDLLALPDDLPSLTSALEPDAASASSEEPPDPRAGRARILEHYRDLRLDRDSVQVRALAEILARLRAKGRRAVLFATPLSDGFLRGTLEGAAYGRYVGTLDRLITRDDQPSIRFYSLDHPSFVDASFYDHAHLGPEGNAQLASNLLALLGVGLLEVPDRLHMAYPEGPDATLVSRIVAGDSDGAPWQAQFDRPLGIDVGDDGRVVIADTGNHCVREIAAGGATVRLLAGRCAAAGAADGEVRWARFDHPISPVIVGDSVFVVDGARRDLREISGGYVATHHPTEQPWVRPRQLRSDGRRLYVLDGKSSIFRYDPGGGRVERLVVSTRGEKITAFDVTPDGRLFLADDYGAIWEWPGRAAARLGGKAHDLILRFDNRGDTPLPQVTGDAFPFAFGRMSLRRVTGLEYVPRYDGVLVQDEVTAHPKLTERVHLRFISFRDERIYPWLRPVAYGGAYMFFNEPAHTFASNVHEGAMALHGASSTLFYLERDRSRLTQTSDGLLGMAKTAHHITPTRYGGFKDLFGGRAGRITAQTHHPELNAHRRLERVPRKGPYFALLLGSSMTAVTDEVGQYSMGRLMEEELQRQLGLREGIRLDLVHRPFRGPTFDDLRKALTGVVATEIPPDVVYFELHSGALYETLGDEQKMAAAIADVIEIASPYGTKIVFLDNDAMSAVMRDGLRAPSEQQVAFLELARDAGIEVLDPSDLLLREHLRLSTWGNPPFSGTHGSVWAIQATAHAFAQLSYPSLAAHLRGRRPAVSRAVQRRDPDAERPEVLATAFAEVEADWISIAQAVATDAAQASVEGRTMELFVDLGKTGDGAEVDAARIDEIVVSLLAHEVGTDPMGNVVTRVRLVLARFSNYDEYGVGQLRGAQVVAERDYDAAGLTALLQASAGRAPD
jgi:hypothetical protein